MVLIRSVIQDLGESLWITTTEDKGKRDNAPCSKKKCEWRPYFRGEQHVKEEQLVRNINFLQFINVTWQWVSSKKELMIWEHVLAVYRMTSFITTINSEDNKEKKDFKTILSLNIFTSIFSFKKILTWSSKCPRPWHHWWLWPFPMSTGYLDLGKPNSMPILLLWNSTKPKENFQSKSFSLFWCHYSSELIDVPQKIKNLVC